MAIPYTQSIDLQKNQVISPTIHPVTSDPASPVEGQLWTRTDLDRMYAYLGGGVEGLALVSDLSDYVSNVEATNLASVAYVDSQIDGLVNAAPGALDTLNELAAAIGDDANFAASMNTALAARTQKYAIDVGNSGDANKFVSVNHNLGTTDVIVQVRATGTSKVVMAEVTITNANAVTVEFATSPTDGQYRVVVVG